MRFLVPEGQFTRRQESEGRVTAVASREASSVGGVRRTVGGRGPEADQRAGS